MEIALLNDIVIIFALAVVVIYVCHLAKLPSIVGLLITGAIAGPHGLGLITSVHEVDILAEIGVILLLFTIGLEFSLGSLLRSRKPVLLGGGLQVGLTIAAGLGLSLLMGWGWGPALYGGFILSLSSTAVVLKLIQDRAQLGSPQGNTSLSILIFQDLIVVPMMLSAPLLAGAQITGGESSMIMAAKGVGVVLLLIAAAKWLAPKGLELVADTRNSELFLISIVLTCLAVAWLTSWAGLSLALGAFIAGLIISESPYGHQAIGKVIPLRDLFTSLFFVSIGMLLDLNFLTGHPGLVALGLGAMMVLKLITGSLATLALGLPLRVALLVGFSLNQIGEFSFILAKTGLEMQLISQADYQFLLAVTVPGMALTPLMMRLGEVVSHRIPAGRRGAGKDEPSPAEAELSDHLIVVGFGLGGRNVARACRAAGITYRVLEMNPRTVRQEKAAGEPIMYGDAVSQAVLEHVGVAKARAMVLTIPDPVATRQVASLVKTLHPSLHLIVRTRYLKEMQTLYKLGADEVVPEEYETAVEIFARVLRRFLVPGEEIARQVAELRAQDYEMLRELSPDRGGVQDLSSYLPGVDIVTWRLAPDSPLNGVSLGQTQLRGKWGVTMLALNRRGSVISNPGADTILQAGDVAVLMGPPQRLRELACQFDKKPDCQTES